MKLNNHVVSLELSIKLKKLSVKQESFFWWKLPLRKFDQHKVEPEIYFSEKYPLKDCTHLGYMQYISAFTSSELGEICNSVSVLFDAHSEYNHIWKKWICFLSNEYCNTVWQEDGGTECDARAKMLIYLIEKNMIKTGDL